MRKLKAFVSIPVVTLLLVLFTVTAYARYTLSQSYTLTLEPGQLQELLLLDQEGNSPVWDWDQENSTLSLSCLVCFPQEQADTAQEEEEAESCTLYLCILGLGASLGVEPDPTAISLTVEGKSYSAVAQELPPTSILYTSFGAGLVYRYYDSGGQELSWTLEQGESLSVSVSISDCSGDALFQLMVTEGGGT